MFICLCLRFSIISCYKYLIVWSISSRDSVSSPNLSGDTSITDILQSMIIYFFPSLWLYSYFSAFYRFQCWLCKRFHFNKSLSGNSWFHDSGTSITMTNCMRMFFYSTHKSSYLEIFNNLFPCFKSIQSRIFSSVFIYLCIRRKNIYHLQSRSFRNFIIVWVMCWRHFHYACTKFHIYIFVSYDWNFFVYQWQQYFFSD